MTALTEACRFCGHPIHAPLDCRGIAFRLAGVEGHPEVPCICRFDSEQETLIPEGHPDAVRRPR